MAQQSVPALPMHNKAFKLTASHDDVRRIIQGDDRIHPGPDSDTLLCAPSSHCSIVTTDRAIPQTCSCTIWHSALGSLGFFSLEAPAAAGICDDAAADSSSCYKGMLTDDVAFKPFQNPFPGPCCCYVRTHQAVFREPLPDFRAQSSFSPDRRRCA